MGKTFHQRAFLVSYDSDKPTERAIVRACSCNNEPYDSKRPALELIVKATLRATATSGV